MIDVYMRRIYDICGVYIRVKVPVSIPPSAAWKKKENIYSGCGYVEEKGSQIKIEYLYISLYYMFISILYKVDILESGYTYTSTFQEFYYK